MATVTSRFDAPGGMTAPLLGAMKTLADTVTDHERRITSLEIVPLAPPAARRCALVTLAKF